AEPSLHLLILPKEHLVVFVNDGISYSNGGTSQEMAASRLHHLVKLSNFFVGTGQDELLLHMREARASVGLNELFHGVLLTFCDVNKPTPGILMKCTCGAAVGEKFHGTALPEIKLSDNCG